MLGSREVENELRLKREVWERKNPERNANGKPEAAILKPGESVGVTPKKPEPRV